MKHRSKYRKNKIRGLRPKRSIFKRPVFWASILLLLLAGSAFYLFFFFPKFQVQAITILGNEKIASQDIQALAWRQITKNMPGFTYKNIFTIDAGTLKKDLLTGFPEIEEVKVQKQWLQNIHIEITERKPFAVFCPGQNNQNCFTIDKNGVIYEAKPTVSGDNFIVRQMIDQTKLVTGQTVVDKHIIEAIVKVKDDLQNNFQINLKEALSSNPLIFTTTEGWKMYLDPTLDISMQITKMDILLKNEITPAIRKHLQYIYLQYKDRAYYK